MLGQPLGFRTISRLSPAMQLGLHHMTPHLAVHIPMFVQRRCASSVVFGDAGQGEDSVLNFRAPLYPLAMPITTIPNTRGIRAQLECFSPSPSRRRQRDEQFSDATGVNAEFGWATWPGTLEVRFSRTKSYRPTEPLAAPLGRRESYHRFEKQLQLCLLRSRLIVKHIINICEPQMLIPIPWTGSMCDIVWFQLLFESLGIPFYNYNSDELDNRTW
ncbi:hypothetical protein B0H19DRAFT_1071969 [Mycena capillaripes]|nr:hypothetical protein B0H19DRAFT_1071969 [Mycena capillaripes]